MGYSLEQNTSIIMSYYRNGVLKEDGDWVYSGDACKNAYLLKYPGVIEEETLKTHIRHILARFNDLVTSVRENRRGDFKLVKTLLRI